MIVAALLVLVGLVTVPWSILRRVSPASARSSSSPPARGGAARAATQPETSGERRTRRAWRALLLLAVLLLVFAWAIGQVTEEARTYAEVHAMPGNAGEPERTLRTALLACAGVLLVGAALLRSALGARRRDH
ncbi:MAG: hypothetical protein AVDCRST_MAG07-3137 [uncultured Frankineae bacterium]|uniref:Uncharacterized protein n=1 Tax=uncultured Frankineae bacterium TaxID=437475 RepID=A0A6J4M859_9ACTN|nr:MAG: hypothetical protein AVDCRST_MAG07-3137 [uncultured Frankineae bacterium]